jgi:uncharacterized membrane protein
MVDRMLFFSDAVFAIVLTILVLELRPPETDVRNEGELLNGIFAMGRHFASFAISFAVGGIFWLAHMRFARNLREFDWPAAGANLLHLFTITLLPFAAALLGQHINSITAFATYTIIIMLVAFTSAFSWLVASRDGGRLVGGTTQPQRMGAALRTSAIGIAFGLGLPFTLAGHPNFGRFSWVLIFPIIGLANWIGRKSKK